MALLLIVGAAAAVLPGVADEFQWATMRDSGAAGQTAFLRGAAERSPDPAYPVWLLANGLPKDVAERRLDAAAAATISTELLRKFERDLDWYAPLALVSIESAFRARAVGQASIDEVERTVARARASDRASGCFDFVAADRFAQLGLERRALAHARAALGHPLSPEIRARLERYVQPDTLLP
jgi:hypothetical protein